MKSIKFGVLGATIVAMGAVFMNWISVSEGVPKTVTEALPMTGMDNGGPVFLFLLGMPLLGAGIGALKRFGRGLAALSFVGSLLAVFLGLVKWVDIDDAAQELSAIGATIGGGSGYSIFFLAASAACLASFVGLIKPEKKPELAPVGGRPAHA